MLKDDGELRGVYRDGRYAVVDLRGFRFPFRCVKTNRPVPYHSRYHVKWYQHAVGAYAVWFAATLLVRWVLAARYGQVGLVASLAFLLFTCWLVTSIIRRSQILWIGLDEAYRQRRKRRARIGWRLTLSGLIGLFVLAVVEVAMSSTGVVRSPHALSRYMPLGLALVTLSGLPFLLVAYWPVLWRRRRRPPFVWLAGAHPDFLASLPRWQPASAAAGTHS